jgi:hypothetical protein
LKVSEVITIDHIQSWKAGDIVTISAGTGAGKSHFIKNKLYDYAKNNSKEILFLIHRKDCYNQFKFELEQASKNDAIEIMTYQSIEYKIRNGIFVSLSQYHYIVCDEYHYWMESDSKFNKFTDISMRAVMNSKQSIRILMSATAERTKGYINKNEQQTIDYSLPINFNHINLLNFYYSDDTLDEFVKLAIETNKKVIFFFESAKKAFDLHKKYKDITIFNCSKSNPNYYKYVDQNEIDQILKEERFDNKRILITTMTMSTGINIIDNELDTIIVDSRDVDTIIQCIGRKRIINKNDKIDVIIKSISNQQLGGIITQLNKKIKMGRFFREHGIHKFLLEYPRESDNLNMLYDVIEDGQQVKKINMLMYAKYLMDIVDIQHMLGKLVNINLRIKYGFPKFIARKLGFWDSETNEYSYSIWEDEKGVESLEMYLENVIGKQLLKEDQKELIKKVNLKDSRGRVQKSITILNAYFTENKMNYMIVSKVTSELVEGKKKSIRFWEVLNNISNTK